MRARMKVYDWYGQTAATADVGLGPGILPTIGLTFSAERGSGGGALFSAHADHLTALGAWDCVLILQVEFTEGVWTSIEPYTLRPPFVWTHVELPIVNCSAVALLKQWATETVIMPEYTVGDMPRGAGTDRVLGWPSSFYSPAADAAEAWDGCYETSRTTMPSESAETRLPWPSGTGALWISITDASDVAERKLFRTSDASPLSIAAAGPIRIYAASDSPGKLYVAGEPVLYIDGGEPGKEPIIYQQVDMWVEPGDYACAFDTMSIWDAGGDGVDPFICAICTLDANGDPDTWLLVTNETDWSACRRNDEPPGNEPPGPTPGQMLSSMVTEAQARSATGWSNVTLGFTDTHDSYGEPWEAIVVERNVRYCSDSYWAVWNALGESNEVDVWLDASLELQAAPRQGEDLTGTLTDLGASDIASMGGQGSPDAGTWVGALAWDGWIFKAEGGSKPRREFGMEIGTAISRAVADRIVTAVIGDNGRWDARASLAPLGVAVPYQQFKVGDTIPVSYGPYASVGMEVLSISGMMVEDALQWQVELGWSE